MRFLWDFLLSNRQRLEGAQVDGETHRILAFDTDGGDSIFIYFATRRTAEWFDLATSVLHETDEGHIEIRSKEDNLLFSFALPWAPYPVIGGGIYSDVPPAATASLYSGIYG